MEQYLINHVIILVLCLMNDVTCDAPQMNPAAAPTITANSAGGPGSNCNNSAIAALYAMIPDIINGCTQIQNQISQGFQFIPNASSPMELILQNVQWQNMLVSCDMIIKTKQMADQVQATSANAQSQASAPLPTTAGNTSNTPGNLPPVSTAPPQAPVDTSNPPPVSS